MELKSIYGDVIFARKGARTILELVTAAVAAKKSLGGADLGEADLGGADLGGAYLGGAYLRGAYLRGAKITASQRDTIIQELGLVVVEEVEDDAA